MSITGRPQFEPQKVLVMYSVSSCISGNTYHIQCSVTHLFRLSGVYVLALKDFSLNLLQGCFSCFFS